MQIIGASLATFYGKPRRLGRFNDRTDILVGSRRFLRDTALRGAFHKDTALLQLIDDLAPAPILERAPDGGSSACPPHGKRNDSAWFRGAPVRGRSTA
jgi:hypothetical protein